MYGENETFIAQQHLSLGSSDHETDVPPTWRKPLSGPEPLRSQKSFFNLMGDNSGR